MMAAVELTERQAQVAQGLARHLKLKEIATELDISVSAVSKHVAALKDAFGAKSHAEIVAGFYAMTGATPLTPWVEKNAWNDFHLSQTPIKRPNAVADDPGLLSLADGADFPLVADRGSHIEWPGLDEPRVVPRWLDGRDAGPARLAVVVGGMFVFVAALVLTISAVRSLSEVVAGSGPNLAMQSDSAT